MLAFIRKHIFWKFFFSYFSLVLIGMLVMGVIIRVALPGLFNNQLVAMSTIFSNYGISETGHMMGGRGMMGGSLLYSDLYGVFNKIILEAFIYAFFPSIFIALVLSAMMSRRFVRPLKQMGEAADRIAAGDYQERLPLGPELSGGQDELQRLGRRFNLMASRLEKVEENRQKWLSDVAHELRTPLTVIKGSMEGLMDGVLEPDSATLERVYRQADRLERLVNDLQELNRIDEGGLELDIKPILLNLVIANVLQTMRINFANQGITLEEDLPDRPITVLADEDRLEQILINLLGNALRYTSDGGRVVVSAQALEAMTEVAVSDDGAGISAEHLPYIFDRFYRVEESRSRQEGGSGLGLAIVKKLVEAQGGQITVDSMGLGKGAAFKFTLPNNS
ncbi:MAG: HAMP domain-containing protein [Anaerolineaceae bacterium]|nr:HAMP domain-containing protein [Anaerolineaceae bacterium]